MDNEPVLVIVNSGGMHDPVSKEILVNKIVTENKSERSFKKHVIPVNTPCKSTDNVDFVSVESETGEIQMIDINLESENEIILNDNKNGFESIVLTYLHDNNSMNKDNVTVIKKNSPDIEALHTETILEDKQLSPRPGPSKIE